MSNYRFVGNHIECDPPKRPKKLTATRFATILGLNTWASSFEAWCAMTRVYEAPFEDTIYTAAGKVIEPKIIKYLQDRYFMDIKSPTDVYGQDYFKKTWGDFFPNSEALGGMWDALGDDFVVEIKTTKRAEDWYKNGEVNPPIYYKLQAALYAWLLGFDDVVMTGSFLKAEDYEHPEDFEPNINNTVIYEFKVSEEFPNFDLDFVNPALRFWKEHVLTGVSPDFDEKKDAEILKALRTTQVDTSGADITKLIKEGEKLKSQINKADAKIADKRKRLKEIEDAVKAHMAHFMGEDDKTAELDGKAFKWTLTRSQRASLDTTKLKKELPDVASKYTKTSTVYTLKTTEKEEA